MGIVLASGDQDEYRKKSGKTWYLCSWPGCRSRTFAPSVISGRTVSKILRSFSIRYWRFVIIRGWCSAGRSIDGTKIEANSGRNKITFRKKLEKSKTRYEDKIEQILKEAEDIDAEEDRLYGDKNGYSLDREYTSDEIKEAMKKVQREKEKL
jgi:hypothetical protein